MKDESLSVPFLSTSHLPFTLILHTSHLTFASAGRLSLDLTPIQISILERLLKAGFKFVTIERIERYLGVEKDGFVALLEPSEGKLRVFGQVGYRLGEGVGMLIEKGEGKAFVWKSESVSATPELLAGYERFRTELQAALRNDE